MVPGSPFHDIDRTDWIASNDAGFAIWDAYPVNPGHALVVPHHLVSRWWDLDAGEQAGVLDLVAATRSVIDELHHPAGYNVGFNDGAAAGQTVSQFHVHVIPRFDGDVNDPRGGVRHVISERGNYLTEQPSP